ncbi:hypothetical protein [Escherichia coli]|uniref:hypothetical protein n=1 Tax=Escherichia coli TaxID=562 RepID=UPI000BE9D58F|nr:hypothetical protein [Escherichia coli]
MNNGENKLLGSLLAQKVKRSKTGRIRERFAEIEEAQQQGIRNIDIVNALNDEGFDLTLKTFENILHRIRKERAEKKDVSHLLSNKEKTYQKAITIEDKNRKTKQDNDILNAYLPVCFNNAKIAQQAIDNNVSIETIKSWNCANFVQVRNTLGNYIRNKR